jgi:hypothetical protein
MSDLNDLIATNSINAFNQGVQTGARQEQERIIKLLEDRLTGAQETKQANGQITAMRVPVDYDQLEAVIEACIYAIKGENK